MSDEQRKDEIDVESHRWRVGTSEDATDVTETETESEVEAHVMRVPNVRMDSPSNS
jgi:hypothetical protein